MTTITTNNKNKSANRLLISSTRKMLIFKRLGFLILALTLAAPLALLTACNAPCDCENPASSTQTYTSAELYTLFAPSVAEINVDNGGQIGTAFLVRQTDSSLYVVTSHHIVEELIDFPSTPITLEFYHPEQDFSDRFNQSQITLIGYDAYFDIALLRVERSAIWRTRLPIRFSANQTPNGEALTALGNADGHGIAVFGGLLSNNNRILDLGENEPAATRFKPVYQVSISMNRGTSGGPVFCTQGYLVGIGAFQRVRDTDGNPLLGVSYILPAQIILPLINNAISASLNANLIFEGNHFSSPVARMNGINSLTFFALGGLTLTRQGNNFGVAHAGTAPGGVTGGWFRVGDVLSNVTGVDVQNLTWTQLIALFNHYTVLNLDGEFLAISTIIDVQTVRFSNFRRPTH